ncbi:MAG TPA: HlyD family efflux transporter periplasmic adaptor subunit [Nevskiaceae bacterium]|nr:HlyD family efflux transporter periplasmic adaptor subunit [Nevskiaceae bacterium]
MSDAADDDDAPPFLDTDPPHWVARSLAALILALFTVAALVLAFLKVPESVSSPFVLVPVRGTDPVRALENSVVLKVGVREGQAVKRGDLLFVVRTDLVSDRSSELGALETQVTGVEASVVNATEQYRKEQLADAEEKARLQARVADLDRVMTLKKKQLDLTKELVSRYEKIREGGYGSREQLIQQELAMHRIEAELAQARADRHEAHSSLEKLGFDAQAREIRHRERIRSLREDSDKAAIRMRSLKDDPMRAGDGVMTIASPCDATVIRQPVKTAGAVVMEGDVLGELACAGEPLEAELSIPPAKTGRLETGQRVKLFYDAFPYQRYGVRYATLRWISPASTRVGDADTFRALAEVGDTTIATQGGPRLLRAGMGGTAKVSVGRRTLLSYAFDPIRALQENLASPPDEDVGKDSPHAER